MTDPAPVQAVAPSTRAGGADIRQLLVDSARQLFESQHRSARIKLNAAPAQPFDAQLWRQMAELGWLAIALPEALQGSNLGLACAGALAEQFGRSRVPEPFIACGLMPAALCGGLPGTPARDAIAADLLSGDALWTLAWQEHAGRVDTRNCETRLSADGRLAGHKVFVPNTDLANGILVLAGGGEPALVLVRKGTPGLQMDTHPTTDRNTRAHLQFHAVPVEEVLVTGQSAVALVNEAVEAATLASAAFQTGLAESVLEQVLAHLRSRVQFGRPLGTLQTLQHRAANLYMLNQVARASWHCAAERWDAAPGSATACAAISAAKARAAQAALDTAQAAVQLLGGLGFAEEAEAGLALRLAMLHSSWLGGRRHHLRRFAELLERSA